MARSVLGACTPEAAARACSAPWSVPVGVVGSGVGAGSGVVRLAALAGSGSNACASMGEPSDGEGLSAGAVLGAVSVWGVFGLGAGFGFGCGFSTKATRVRAAGERFSSLDVEAISEASMVRVCIGPVRSGWELLSCQSSVPARLSRKNRCNTSTRAPQRSKLRVLGRPVSGASGGGLGRMGRTVLMASSGV